MSKQKKTNSQVTAALDRLRILVEQAHGDASVVPEIRQILDDNPEIWQYFGDLADKVERVWIKLYAGKHSPQIEESLLRKLAAMKAELAGEDPSPLEALLVDRILSTWLQTKYYELAVAATHAAKASAGRQADSVQKRLEGAQRRHLAAIKALTDFRKLMPKASQKPTGAQTGRYGVSSFAMHTEDRRRLRAAVPDELCVTLPFTRELGRKA